MQAIHITAHGDPSVLRVVDVPTPVPGPGQVLAKVLATSVNHLDLWVRRGMPGMTIPLPRIPGCDGTGVVTELGPGVASVSVGQEVVLLPGYSSGKSAHDRAGDDHLSDDYGIRGEHGDGFACEYVALDERYVMPLPEGVDAISAAAVPLVFLTAWGMLVTRAAVKPGERVLVIGGASGVGSAAIQIAKDAGARVVATAGNDEKRALCRELGADETVDHGDPEWPRRVRGWSGGQGVDVVVEHVGPATWEGSMRSLARNGRLVTCGGTSGPKVTIVLPHLFIKNIAVHGSTMGPKSAFPAIFRKVAEGRFLAVVDRVLPLSRCAEAHRLLEARTVRGKIVLTPGA